MCQLLHLYQAGGRDARLGEEKTNIHTLPSRTVQLSRTWRGFPPSF
jgi:hypothetical protein